MVTTTRFSWDGAFTDEMRTAFDADGYLILEDFFTPDECDTAKAHAVDLMQSHEPGAELVVFSAKGQSHAKADYFRSSGDQIRFFLEEGAVTDEGELCVPIEQAVNKIGHNLHDDDPVFSALSRAPQMAEVAKHLFAAPKLLQSMYICKNAHIGGEVNCHQDSTFLYTEPQSCVGFWIAIEDATTENGCMWAATGGHHAPLRKRFHDVNGELVMSDLDNTPIPDADVALTAPKGTLVLLHGRVPHLSGANHSAKSRHAYAVHMIDGTAEYPEGNWLQRGPEHPLLGF